MTIPAWAKPNSEGTVKTTINLQQQVTMHNSTLTPGRYEVVVEGNQAKFKQDGKVVAEIPCTWKTLPSKSQYSAVLVKNNQITEIDFSGKTQAINFSSEQTASN